MSTEKRVRGIFERPWDVKKTDVDSVAKALGLKVEHGSKHDKYSDPRALGMVVVIPRHRDVDEKYIGQFCRLLRFVVSEEWTEDRNECT